MLLFNKDVEITAEGIDWLVYGVKAMDYHYFIKIPRWLKEKAESTKEEFNEELKLQGIDFKDLVIDKRKEKGRRRVYENDRSNGRRSACFFATKYARTIQIINFYNYKDLNNENYKNKT